MFTFDDLDSDLPRTPTPNGSRELPFLVEDVENPFLRGWTDHSRRRQPMPLPVPRVEVPAVLRPTASAAGDINPNGRVVIPR